jgi:uncharacterized protein YjbI with pentapeptide repeats
MPLPFVPIWEEYRQGERDFRKFYLASADLKAAVMPNINLQEADLSDSNLQGADLSGADLSQADLSRANLHAARLVGANLTGANLVGANFSDTDLTDARLDKTYLRLADFTRANLTRATLVEADGRGWLETDDKKNIRERHTSFQEAILRGANLSEAYLRMCNFRGADLSEAKLISADLSGVDATPLPPAKGSKDNKPLVTLFNAADLNFANLRKARITYCDFRKANLHGADLRQAQMGGSFREADLSQAILLDTAFSKCDLTNADLTATNLESSQFNNVRMPNGEPPGKDLVKFTGLPPYPGNVGGFLKPITFTEFWFETYEELKALSWPALCACCGRDFDRYERYSHEVIEAGSLRVYEVRVPYCTECLLHGVRGKDARQWMKPTCAAPGGKEPACKFEVKSKMLSAKDFFVLTFANQDYVMGFANGNALPLKGIKGNW